MPQKKISQLCLGLISLLMASCSGPSLTTVAPTISDPDITRALLENKKPSAQAEAIFQGRTNLDKIEGGWAWADGNYSVVIVNSEGISNSQYDYVGICTSAQPAPNRRAWKDGDIKFALSKTSVPTVFTGIYRMGNGAEEGASFFLKEESNLIEIVGTGAREGNPLLIRTYPLNEDSDPDADTGISRGTGFFVSDNGLILTAYHVVENAKSITVTTSDGATHKATIVRSSRSNDLALLKTEILGADYLPLRKTSGLSLGTEIFTMGFPATGILGAEIKYSNGSIASLSGVEGEQSLLQMTVPIQPGNSGGPVVTEDGFAIGVVTSTAAILPFVSSTGSLPQNVNWAVKADYAMLLHEQQGKLSAVNEIEAIERTSAATCLITCTN